MAWQAQLAQVVQRIDGCALLVVETAELLVVDGLVEVAVGASRPMHLSCSSPFGHDESIRIASVALSVVHDSQAVSDFVRDHKGRLEVGRLVDGAAVVALAHSAYPSQSEHSGMVAARSCLVQIQTSIVIRVEWRCLLA